MLQPLHVSLALRPQFQQLCKTKDTVLERGFSFPKSCRMVLTQLCSSPLAHIWEY